MSQVSKPKYSLEFLLVVVVISYIILGSAIILSIGNWEERGQFGDLFGSVNGLFSALAFGALVYSIWLQRFDLKNQNKVLSLQVEELKNQREELAMQREELKLTREELAKTREQHEITAKANKEQLEESRKQSIVNNHMSVLQISGKSISSGDS